MNGEIVQIQASHTSRVVAASTENVFRDRYGATTMPRVVLWTAVLTVASFTFGTNLDGQSFEPGADSGRSALRQPTASQRTAKQDSALLSEAINAWKAIGDTKWTRCLARKEQSLFSGRKVAPCRMEVKRINNCFLVRELSSIGRDQTAESVYARNSKYSFHINQGSRPAWILGYYGEPQSSVVATAESLNAIFLDAPWQVATVPLPLIFVDPSFSAKVVTSRDDKYGSLVEVAFALNSKVEVATHRLEPIKGGKVVLIPGLRWVVKEYDVEILGQRGGKEEKLREQGHIEYSEDTQGSVPTPKRFRSQITDSRNRTATTTIEYEEYGSCAAKEDDFTLSEFGLPEPGAKPSSHLRYFLIASGVLLTALGIWRWRAKKKV